MNPRPPKVIRSTKLVPVALHDVSAENFREIDAHIEQLSRWGIRRMALMVIPYPGDGSSEQLRGEFGAWLQAKRRPGSNCSAMDGSMLQMLQKSAPFGEVCRTR